MNKKLFGISIGFTVVIFVFAGIMAFVSFKQVLFPVTGINTVEDVSDSTVILIEVDSLNLAPKINSVYLVFFHSVNETVILAEKIPFNVLEINSDIEVEQLVEDIVCSVEQYSSLSADKYLVIDKAGINIINNSYENLQFGVLTPAEVNFCEILKTGEVDDFSHVFAEIAAHVISNITPEYFNATMAGFVGNDNCYYELVEK